MDGKDQVTDDLYQILEDLFEKTKQMRHPDKKTRINQPLEENKLQEKTSTNEKDNIRTGNHDSEKRQNNERRIPLSQLSYKELADTKNKLNELKKNLNESPRKYSKELQKIETVNNKLNNAMDKRKQKDINNNINNLNQKLNRNPRSYVLRVIETKGKLDSLRVNLEKNPRENKPALDKLNKLEKKMDSKIEKMRSSQINRAIYAVHKNPKKYSQELNKYKDIKMKLDKERSHTRETSKEISKPKEKSKAAELTR